MRMVKSSNAVKAFLESGKYSDVVYFPCVKKSHRRCRNDKISTESLQLRLVQVDLLAGASEVLVSSLTDQQAYPTALVANLYHQCWGVEDLHAKLLTINLAAYVIYDTKRKKKKTKDNRLYEYKINFTFTINQLKDNVVRFTMKLAEFELYELLISKISKNLRVIRPNCKFSDKTVETRQIIPVSLIR